MTYKNATSPRPVSVKGQNTGTPQILIDALARGGPEVAIAAPYGVRYALDICSQPDLKLYKGYCSTFMPFVAEEFCEDPDFVAADCFSHDWANLLTHCVDEDQNPNDYFIWCNPPYAKIPQFLEYALSTLHVNDNREGFRANVSFLIPAAVGSNYFQKYVMRPALDGAKIYVDFLNPRLTFKGHSTPYPKDLMLVSFVRNDYLLFDFNRDGQICRQFRWKQND